MAFGLRAAANSAGDLSPGPVTSSAKRRARMWRCMLRTVNPGFVFAAPPAAVVIPQYIVVEVARQQPAISPTSQCPTCSLCAPGPASEMDDPSGQVSADCNDILIVQAPVEAPVEADAQSTYAPMPPRCDADDLSGPHMMGTGTTGEMQTVPSKIPAALPCCFGQRHHDLSSLLANQEEADSEVMGMIIFLAQVHVNGALCLDKDLPVQRAHLSSTVERLLDIILDLEDMIPVRQNEDYQLLLDAARQSHLQYVSWVADLDELIGAAYPR